MIDSRLKDREWRRRVGFDNIDAHPDTTVVSPRKKPVESDRFISNDIDSMLFGRKAR
jgi:hypothetical protein